MKAESYLLRDATTTPRWCSLSNARRLGERGSTGRPPLRWREACSNRAGDGQRPVLLLFGVNMRQAVRTAVSRMPAGREAEANHPHP